MSISTKQLKKQIRNSMVKQRRDMDPFERERISDKIVQKFLDSNIYRDSKTIMAYVPMHDEVQLNVFFEQAFKDGKRLAVPLITGSGTMRPVLLPSLDVLIEGEFGIKTVREEDRIFLQPDAFDCVLIPGAAFDYLGHRLGLGSGYYDNFLPRTNATKIALAFDFQLIYQVPYEIHDVNVDVIITEEKIDAIYDWGMQIWIKPGTPRWL